MKNREKSKPTKKKIVMYYLILAACILLLAAITLAVVFSVRTHNGNLTIDNTLTEPTDPTQPTEPTQPGADGDSVEDPTDTATASVFISPVANIDVTQKQDLWYDATLRMYYLHQGIDFSAAAGEEVLATVDGTVTSITYDLLDGGRITISHEGGIETVYKYVDPVEELKVGSKVNRGDVIATVSADSGAENGEGAHLHFEVYKNGVLADPEDYLGTEK